MGGLEKSQIYAAIQLLCTKKLFANFTITPKISLQHKTNRKIKIYFNPQDGTAHQRRKWFPIDKASLLQKDSFHCS
uniref:Uncharacterized protein n=1 Tax=Rhizophora mucronata TaxID=61149 RepID=A0A2P2NX41_RHIMU